MRKAPFLLMLVAPLVLAATTYKLRVAAVTTYSDGSAVDAAVAVTYNLYGGDCSAARPLPQLATGLTDGRSARQPAAGKLHCYYGTAVINGVESDPSKELQIDLRKPAAPAGVTIEP